MRDDEERRGADSGRDAIEERMDAALRSYAQPAEVPEMQVALAQLLERARESESQRRRGWVWGAVATAAGLAMIFLVGIVWLMRGPRQREIAWTPKAPAVAQVKIPSEEPVATPRGVAQPTSAGSRRAAGVRAMRTAAVRQLPKQDTFPTPRPLSADEEALMTFVHRAPPPVRKAVIEDQQHWDDPIIVAELKKPPLETGGRQNP